MTTTHKQFYPSTSPKLKKGIKSNRDHRIRPGEARLLQMSWKQIYFQVNIRFVLKGTLLHDNRVKNWCAGCTASDLTRNVLFYLKEANKQRRTIPITKQTNKQRRIIPKQTKKDHPHLQWTNTKRIFCKQRSRQCRWRRQTLHCQCWLRLGTSKTYVTQLTATFLVIRVAAKTKKSLEIPTAPDPCFANYYRSVVVYRCVVEEVM